MPGSYRKLAAASALRYNCRVPEPFEEPGRNQGDLYL